MTDPRFAALLVLQDLDTDLDRLRTRRSGLPQRAELERVDVRRRDLAVQHQDAVRARDEVAARQAALEAELDAVEHRITEVNSRLYGGTVTASRELTAMAADVEVLGSRRGELEERALEAMEEREPHDALVASLQVESERLQAEQLALEAALAEAERGIDEEVASARKARDEAADAVAGDLVELYERLRSRLGGVGAARLAGSSCSGCHLTLPATEVARLKREPADSLVLCDQCGRILVRP